MIRGVVSKVAWMARATTTVVGLAIMLALVLGIASTALGKNGNPFILGKAANTATKVTGLIGKVASGSALVVKNPSGGEALDLSVGDPVADPSSKTVAPMKVDSQAKVDNLNVDQLDGNDSAALQKRVSGACAVGSSIRSIDANGVVTCETDDDLSGDLALGDLSGNYPNPLIANGAVMGGIGGKIADNTVTAHDIALNTLTQDDIATGGVGSAEVENGGLDLVDVAEWSGTASLDPPSINAQSCSLVNIQIPGIDPGDFAVVTAPDLGNYLLPFPMQSEADGLLKVRLCNSHPANAIDGGSGTWRYIVFDDGEG